MLQLRKYISRIRLLDAGLLEEAHYVASLHPSMSEEQLPATTNSLAPDEEMVAAAIPKETAAEFVVRMEEYVKYQLHIAKKRGGVKDEYKDGLVYEERKRVLHDFGRKGWVKCARCTA